MERDCNTASLVPRPFPPPVFDHLQYANMEGEGLGDLIMCGDVRDRQQTHRGWCPTKYHKALVGSVRGLEASTTVFVVYNARDRSE